MRILVFILTLLTAFQPASWAAVDCAPKIPNELQLSISNFTTQDIIFAQPEARIKPGIKMNTAALSRTGYLYMADTTSDTSPSNCLMCTNSCTSAPFLQPDMAPHVGQNLSSSYPALVSRSFNLLAKSPDIRPPRARS